MVNIFGKRKTRPRYLSYDQASPQNPAIKSEPVAMSISGTTSCAIWFCARAGQARTSLCFQVLKAQRNSYPFFDAIRFRRYQ
ncbi:hypothetical protein pipiens_015887 [Culex pipiens pipiens]|uniref:Uncharacterized protein n=1 Tax=Culex pipiens pipiens TaxID=38569 RepID=A0ABD1CP17_CULPP